MQSSIQLLRDRLIERKVGCPNCNVILISLDTLRAKSLPCYGYSKETMPNLCAFASRSIVFQNAYSQSAYTLDGHFSMLTSLYPSQHKMIDPFKGSLNPQVDTLPLELKRAEYTTYYIGGINYSHLPLERGLGRGFDHYLSAETPNDWVQRFKTVDTKKKFFAFFHTFRAHAPYFPTRESVQKFSLMGNKYYFSCDEIYNRVYAEFTKDHKINQTRPEGNPCYTVSNFIISYYKTKNIGQEYAFSEVDRLEMDAYNALVNRVNPADRPELVQALYEANVYELDRELKEFFDYLQSTNMLSNTIVVIASDHGEELYEHGRWGHVEKLYNESIRVPLIIYIPKIKPKPMDVLAQVIDIPPTVLGLVGGGSMQQAIGKDLFSREVSARSYIYSEVHADRKQAIISKTWKFIFNKEEGLKELYNLRDDPGETTNVTNKYPIDAKDLESTLKQNIAGRRVYEPAGNQQFPDFLNEEDRKKLLQTGYR